MKTKDLLNEILAVLHTVKEDKNKLEKIHNFLFEEIYEEPEQIKVPERYKEVLTQIAENIDSGLICFLNPETLELEDIPVELYNDPNEFEAMTGETFDSIELKHTQWEKCITFEPLESHHSFEIMEQFTNQIEDNKLQSKLINALNNRRPFANFKSNVENSSSRQEWFDFKRLSIEEHIKDMLLSEIEDE